MPTNTRDQFIATAQKLFARKGFYGVSIAAIATELGLTKQALLHHFGSKEKLYGEVLQQISDALMTSTADLLGKEPDPAARLASLILTQYRLLADDADAARLIMRELLDNEDRADAAATWYLQPYLDALIDTLLSVPRFRKLDRGQALAVVYQLLGAAHYFAVSHPTLSKMFGASAFREAKKHFEAELEQLILGRLRG